MGAGLGFLFGGPLGAIVGGAVQHIASQGGSSFKNDGPAREEAKFVSFLVAMMTKIAMADGRVSQEELNIIRDFFVRELGYGGLELRYIEGLIQQTKAVNPDLGQIAREFRHSSRREQSLLALDICYRVAAADGTICLQEQSELRFLAENLGVTVEEHQRIRYKYSGFQGSGSHSTGEQVPTPESSDYSVLGVSPSATNAEIKKAYRQMAGQYHPDKVSHLGKELVEFANTKFLEINKAYENIRKTRSF